MDEKDVFNEKYFKPQKFLLKLVYLWPYQHRKKVARTCVLLTVISAMLPHTIRTVEESQAVKVNSNIFMENCCGFMYFAGILGKYIASILSEKKFKFMYEQISKDWKEINEKDERNILQRTAAAGYRLSKLYIMYDIFGAFCFVSIPAIVPTVLNVVRPLNVSRPLALCYYAEYFVDQQKYFSYLYIHTLVVHYVMLVIVMSVDTTYVACVQHVIGLFHIVGYRLHKASELIKRNGYSRYIINDTISNKVGDYVISSIRIHQQSIEFSETLRKAYNTFFFMSTLAITVGLSIISINVVEQFKDISYVGRIASLLIGIITYQFYISWTSQNLLDCSSDGIIKAIYGCGWYTFPVKYQHLIKLMLVRCVVPCQITAGPFMTVNLRTTGLAFRTAVQYFTVATSFRS